MRPRSREWCRRLGLRARRPARGFRSVLEDNGAAVAVPKHRLHVGRERIEDGASEQRVVCVCVGRFLGGETSGHVAANGVVGSRLVGDDVELDLVLEKSWQHIGCVADKGHRAGSAWVEVGGERLVVSGHDVNPAVAKSALGSIGIHLDDERAAAVQGHAEALGAAHPAQARGQDTSSGEGAAEVRPRDGLERLVREPEDPLCADVEPAGGRHLTEHRQAGVLEPVERVLVGPGRHDHRRRDEDARRVQMRREDGDLFTGLHDQRFICAEAFERHDDPGELVRPASRPSTTAVDDERRGVLRHGWIEVVEEAAQCAFLLPTAAAQLASARSSAGDVRAPADPIPAPCRLGGRERPM